MICPKQATVINRKTRKGFEVSKDDVVLLREIYLDEDLNEDEWRDFFVSDELYHEIKDRLGASEKTLAGGEWMEPRCRRVLLRELGPDAIADLDALHERTVAGQKIMNDVVASFFKRIRK